MAFLEEELGRVFTAKKLTLAVAESCTGGLLAARITSVPGSSAYLIGGVVSYSNEAKEILLGVPHDLLVKHGAVSGAVAAEMAHRIRERLMVDVGISITGIAGPTGGTPKKPVGLVWIGLSDRLGVQAMRFQWNEDREGNRQRSVDQALRLLLEWAAAR
ncbi:MAG: hypothetical protein Kow00124_19340 [Anaerolineae bacterium]